MKWILLSLIPCLCMASLGVCDESNRGNERNDHQKQPSIGIAELDPKLNGKKATVRFTVTKLEGVAQRHQPGQSPTFVIETKPDTPTENHLTVWVRGDLTNVLHQLQMAYLQENQLKAGTKIEATGKLVVHQMDPHVFSLDVDRWQDFRILPAAENESETSAPARP